MTKPPGHTAQCRSIISHQITLSNTPVFVTNYKLTLFSQSVLDEADLALREQFAWYSIQLYKLRGFCNDTLSDYFAEHFKSYSETRFAELKASTRRELCDVLSSQDVYVRKGCTVLLAAVLREVVQNDVPWPEDDSELPSNQRNLTPITSNEKHSTRISTGKSSRTLKYISNLEKTYTRDEE